MRNNQPVTQREVPLPSDHTLMSTTDPQGQITYANSHFVQISGFSAEELLGSPHNLVRHPDMPAPAFGDMWKTIQGGQPWSAVVKNRCKSGDHYWVRANVCPVFKQGRLVGHISVRTAPSRQEAAACEKLYGDLREGRAGNTHLHKGIVVQGGWRWLWSAWLLLGVRARLRWSCGLLWLAWALCSHFVLQLSQGQMLQSMGLSAVLTFITYAFLAHEIATPVETLQQQALDIVTGRTREEVHLERVDEVGMTLRTVNQLGMMFRWLIDDVTSQAVQLQTGVSEIAQGNHELSQRTEQAAARVQQTVSEMNQLTESVAANAQTARQASGMAQQASEAALQGGRAVATVVDTMHAITQSSKRIGDIIGVIDSIAFQTNILALNAAVEAARAGEQGRGFAVVASEVRSLAQRSANAAKEIKTLINASLENVGAGVRQVDDTGKAMDHIVAQVKQVSDLISEISAATEDQSRGISHASQAVSDLDQLTQQNAALVEEYAAASSTLRQQSQDLVQSVSVFR